VEIFMRLAFSAGVLAVSVALIGGLGGCSHPSDETQPALIPAVASPVADVPIPAGFAMTGDSTSKVEASGLRFVDHKYDGTDDVLPVVRFYKDQMPTKGWTFVDQNQLVHNEISLHFTKNGEDCVITVKPGTFRTHVQVQINPTGRQYDAIKR
jgi:hypothetical protein